MANQTQTVEELLQQMRRRYQIYQMQQMQRQCQESHSGRVVTTDATSVPNIPDATDATTMSGVTSMSPTAGARSDASPEPESESESGVPNIGTEDPCQNAVQIPEDNNNQVNVRPNESHLKVTRSSAQEVTKLQVSLLTRKMVFARSPEKDEKQRPGRNQAPSQSTDKKDGTLQPNSGANRTITMIITSSEFTPEDAARIPKRTDHVPKDCQLNAVIAKTKKEQGTTVQPIRQPMAVDNNSLNPSTLSPTTTPVEANHGRSNVARELPKCIIRSLHPEAKQGTVKGRIVPPATASSLQHQRQQGKQCQENNSSLQLQRGSTLLRQHPQQVLSAPGHPTAVSSSNSPCRRTPPPFPRRRRRPFIFRRRFGHR
uniref:Uncharacterized protein n=1 Tax=Oryza rufipogon TaxID=4529 RepID=A0A0E0PSA5_ORYRU